MGDRTEIVQEVECCGTCQFGNVLLWKYPKPEVVCRAGMRTAFDVTLTIYSKCGRFRTKTGEGT